MSLVVIWKEKEFAGVCSDGLALKAVDGGFVRAAENVPKVWPLSSKLVLASVGLNWMGETIASSFARMAAERPADDPELFRYCEVGILVMAASLLKAHPPKTIEESLTVSLIGYDGARKRIRCISWLSVDGLEPHELMEKGRVMGYEKAQDIARLLLGGVMDANPSANQSDVCSLLEAVVRDTARLVPDFVGGKVSSCLVLPGRLCA